MSRCGSAAGSGAIVAGASTAMLASFVVPVRPRTFDVWLLPWFRLLFMGFLVSLIVILRRAFINNRRGGIRLP